MLGPGDSLQTLLPLSVLAASLLGSAHCAAMCGPLVLAVAASPGQNALYQLGRLASYLTLGYLAGALGEAFFGPEVRGAAAWVAALSLGAAFVWLGFLLWRGRSPHLLPDSVSRRLLPGLAASTHLPGGLRSATAGALSAFLPCGWLQSFVLGAVAAGDAYRGALFLFFFWMGTLPAMVLAPVALRRLLASHLKGATRTAGALLIAAGLASIGWKMLPLIRGGGQHATEEQSCPASGSH